MKKTFYHLEKGATRRILASALAVCMVFTMSPPITAAQASVSDSGEPVMISGFVELPQNIREQSVPIGTSSVELKLPDTLEASVYAVSEDIDTQPPAEPVAPSEPQDSGTVSTPSDREKPEAVPPTEDTAPPEITPPTEESPAADTSDEDAEQPVQSDEPASKSEIIVENIVPLAASPSDAENNKPEPMPPSNDVTTPAAVTISGITWESNPIYDGDTAGTYIFTVVLPDEYTVENGVSLPEITVTVEEGALSAVEKVIAMIDALPTVDSIYETMPGDADPEFESWLAEMKQTIADIQAAMAAYDALTDEEKALIDEERTDKLMELDNFAKRLAEMMSMVEEATVIVEENKTISSASELVEALGGAASGNVSIAGDTITLQKDITLMFKVLPNNQASAFILNGFEFTLDLNGHTLKLSADVLCMFKPANSANMTLKDSGNGDGIQVDGCAYAIYVMDDGRFTMNSGKIQSSKNGISVDAPGTVTINGGTIHVYTTTGSCVVTNSGNGRSTIHINGGTFVSENGMALLFANGTNVFLSGEPKITSATKQAITIMNANVEIKGNPTVTGGTAANGGSAIFINDKSNADVSIYGGTFTGGDSTGKAGSAIAASNSKGLFVGSAKEVKIYGGTFTAGNGSDGQPTHAIYKNGVGASVSDMLPTVDGITYVFKDTFEDDMDGSGNFPTKIVDGTATSPISPAHVGLPNALLIFALTVDGCTLSPIYDKNIGDYSATVPYTMEKVGITARLSVPANATMTIQYDDGEAKPLNDNARYEQSLHEGENVIKIKVTATNNEGAVIGTNTYTLTITREAPPTQRVTITPTKDDSPWSSSGKSYKLTKDSGATFITDLTKVQDGTYTIYETDGINTGVAVTVNGAAASAVVDYYTVTFYDGTSPMGTPAPQTVLKTNGRVTKPSSDPTKAGYTFAGWKTTNNGSTAFDFTNTAITAATGIYASWTPVAATAPTISSHPADATVTVGSVSESLSVTASAASGHTLAYQWYSNTTNTNSGGSSISGATGASFAIPAGLTKGTYYYYCVVTATRTDNGQTASTTSKAATVTARLGITVTFNSNGGSAVNGFNGFSGGKVTRPGDPTKTGYTFAGWFKESSLANGWSFDSDTLGDSAITLYAKWTPKTDTAYIVKHYQQNLADDNYPAVPTDTENKTGTTDASVTPAVKSYPGFTAPATQTVTIAADGKTVVEYRYTRNSYTLTWNANGGSLTGGTAAGSVKFGASLTAPTATKQGYDFTSWNSVVPATMPANPATYTAQWTAKTDTAYKIEYYQQNVSGSDYTKVSADTESKTGTTGATASVTPVADKYTGFTYNAAAAENKLSGPIAADGSLILKVYYDRNTYTISFNSQGGSAVDSITGVRFGAKITAPTAPARTGYDFGGWYKEAGCTNVWSFGSDIVSEAVTLYAKWTDTAAPAITAAAPTVPTSGWFNANTDMTLTYSDNEGVTALAVSIDGANYTPITLQSTYTVSTEGEHTYKFKATDAAGLFAETDAVTVKLDKAAPTGVRISYEAINTNGFAGFMRTITFDNFFKEKVKVTVTVTDATSGAASGKLDYKAVNNSTDETEPTEDWTTATLDRNGQFSFEVNPDFRGLVWAKGYDLAGNPSGWTSKDLTTEQTPPALVLSGNAPSEDWQKTNITFTVTASDSSGIDSVSVSDTLSGSTPTVTDNGSGTYTITVSANGTHGVTVTAADNAGNTASLPEYTIRIDKTAPTIADENVITESTDGKLTFTVTPSDGTDASGMTGGSAKVEYSTDNSTWQAAADKGDGSYTIELTAASGDLYIKATDAVGNEGSTYHKTGVVLESTKPSVTFSNASLTTAEGGWLTTAQPFTVTTDDKPAGVTVSSGLASLTVDVLHYEGGGYVKDTSLSKAYTALTGTSKISDSISPADGRWKVIATAIDQNGNTTTETRFVRLDTGAPTLSGGTAANITDKTADLQFATTEAGDWYYLLDPETVPAKGEVAASDKTGAAASGQNSIPLDSLTSGSKHTVYVVVKDEAGNISEVLKTEFATKQTAPTADKLEIGYVDETYTLKDGVELFSDPECTTKITGGSITGSIGDTVYIRYPEKTEGGTIIPASDATPVVISARPSAPAAPTLHYANETAAMAENLVYSIEPSGTTAPAYDEASNGAAISITAQIAASGTTTNTIFLQKPASEVAKQFASEGASKEIPARPATPAPGKTDETYPNAGNGKLTGLTAGTVYRVSSDDGTTWKDAVLTGTEILSLTAGSYRVQVKATDSSFRSEASPSVTIGTTAPTQETTPSAEIHYKDEVLTGLTPGGKYEITVDGAAKIVTADENGKVSIDAGWIGKTVDIVKPGNGTTTTDSPAQQLPVPARPAAPTPGKTDETYPKAADGTITQVDNGMEYRKSGDTAWKPITATVVTGLVPGDYEVRIKATDSAFSGAPATVTIGTTAPQKAATPTAAFEAADNTLSNVADDMQYSLDGGATWKDIGAVTSITVTDSINIISDILVKRLGNGTTTTDSDHQKIDLTKAATPNADKTDETAKDAKDGTLTQVSSAMEYQKAGDSTWTAITGDTVTNLAPGTYFVRVKGAGTVLASDPAGPLVIKAFGVVNVPVSGVTVIPTEKTIKAGDTAQLAATVAPADATNKAVRWSSDKPDVATVDATGLVTANATGKAKITATTVDGSKTAFCTVTVPETGAIGGIVTDKDGPVKDASVTVHWGGTTGELVGGPVITDVDGKFSFTGLPRGTYSLVVKRTQGGKEQTITKMIAVTGTVANGDIFMPEGERNTTVEVKGNNTPSVAVEGLDDLFKPENLATEDNKGVTAEDTQKVTAGGSVEIKLTAETKQNVDVAEDARKIQSAAGDKKEIGLLLDLSVFKTVTAFGGTAEPTVKLTELPALMEVVIPIPGELQGKEGLAVLRVHSGIAQTLPTSSGSGEYYTMVGESIILHVQKFSTYAVVNNKTGETPTPDPDPTPPTSGGGGNDGGGSGGSGDDRPIIPDKPEQPQPPVNPTDPVKPGEGTPAPGTTPPSTVQPGTTQPDTDQPDPMRPDGKQETEGTDKTEPDITTEQKPDSGENETQKDEIRDALDDAIKNLPDTLTDEQRQAAIGELTQIADAAIAALDDTSDPDESGRIAQQAQDDMEKLVAEALALAGDTAKPFVLASALLALVAVILAVLNLLGKKRRAIPTAICAALAAATFLITTGWSGFALADWWTLLAAAFTAMTVICMGAAKKDDTHADEDAAK